MVNYCCVINCRRNSKINKQLNYYSLPKSRERQIQWLKAAKRQDLIIKDPVKLSLSYRFCSRHFQVSCIKNKNLSTNAIPTLHLPGDENELNKPPPPPVHEGVFCNNCKQEIKGFRYKCVTCNDYDLCMRCEMQEVHPNHFMLRISRPIKIKIADNLIDKWRRFFKAEHITVSQCNFLGNNFDSDTNDDDPITKPTNTADNLLPKDVKDKIREEVSRVIKENKVEKVLKARISNKSERDKEWSSSYSDVDPLCLSSEETTSYTKKIIAKRKNVDLDTATCTHNMYKIKNLNEKNNSNPMLDRRKKLKLITVLNKQLKPLDSSKQQLYSSKQQTTPSKQQRTSTKQPHSIDQKMQQSPTNNIKNI